MKEEKRRLVSVESAETASSQGELPPPPFLPPFPHSLVFLGAAPHAWRSEEHGDCLDLDASLLHRLMGNFPLEGVRVPPDVASAAADKEARQRLASMSGFAKSLGVAQVIDAPKGKDKRLTAGDCEEFKRFEQFSIPRQFSSNGRITGTPAGFMLARRLEKPHGITFFFLLTASFFYSSPHPPPPPDLLPSS